MTSADNLLGSRWWPVQKGNATTNGVAPAGARIQVRLSGSCPPRWIVRMTTNLNTFIRREIVVRAHCSTTNQGITRRTHSFHRYLEASGFLITPGAMHIATNGPLVSGVHHASDSPHAGGASRWPISPVLRLIVGIVAEAITHRCNAFDARISPVACRILVL